MARSFQVLLDLRVLQAQVALPALLGLQALPPLPSTLTLLAELMELQSHHPKVKTCGETKLVQHAGRCGSCFILLEICVRQPALR